MHAAGVLTIGEFSQLTHLSVRTLRRYHEATLLEPAVVDESTGYRYYGVDGQGAEGVATDRTDRTDSTDSTADTTNPSRAPRMKGMRVPSGNTRNSGRRRRSSSGRPGR